MPIITAKKPVRPDSFNLRINPDERGLIDRAAEVSGKTRTDFVLDAARRAAVEALTEHTLFQVDAATYAKFLAVLDAQPQPNAKLTEGARCQKHPFLKRILIYSAQPLHPHLSAPKL